MRAARCAPVPPRQALSELRKRQAVAALRALGTDPRVAEQRLEAGALAMVGTGTYGVQGAHGMQDVLPVASATCCGVWVGLSPRRTRQSTGNRSGRRRSRWPLWAQGYLVKPAECCMASEKLQGMLVRGCGKGGTGGRHGVRQAAMHGVWGVSGSWSSTGPRLAGPASPRDATPQTSILTPYPAPLPCAPPRPQAQAHYPTACDAAPAVSRLLDAVGEELARRMREEGAAPGSMRVRQARAWRSASTWQGLPL